MTSARAVLDAQITEADFQASVIRHARLRGYWVYHTYDSRHSEAGFPDTVIVHPEHPDWPVVMAELKKETTKPTTAQEAWLEALAGRRIETRLWRPSSWEEIERTLV